jgi:hypothetical protein
MAMGYRHPEEIRVSRFLRHRAVTTSKEWNDMNEEKAGQTNMDCKLNIYFRMIILFSA